MGPLLAAFPEENLFGLYLPYGHDPGSHHEVLVNMCHAKQSCLLAVAQAVQIAYLAHGGVRHLGSLVARAAEKFLGGAFHASLLAGENRAVLETSPGEDKL